MIRRTTPSRRCQVGLATGLLLLTGCTGGSAESDPGADRSSGGDATASAAAESTETEGLVRVETEVGSVYRPEEWKATETTAGQDASFVFEEAGEVVGQMDVIVNSVTPGTAADAVDAAIQGARMPRLPSLRHDRREFVEVPGAASAFLTESHYTTADTGQPARSIDLVAVREDGWFLLTRISALEDAYDAERFRQIVETMQLGDGTPS